MTRQELIKRIADKNPTLPEGLADRIIDTVFDEISGAMAAGRRVEIRGSGAFQCVPAMPAWAVTHEMAIL